MNFFLTRIDFRSNDEEGIDEDERLSFTGDDTIFFGIFLRLLIVVLFEEMIVDDGCSCLTITFSGGDLTIGADVCSVLIEVFGGFLLIDFFNTFCEFVIILGFVGEGTDSFFLILIVVD